MMKLIGCSLAVLILGWSPARAEVREKLVEYLKQYNADGKYTYILPYMRETINILYVNDANNITEEVIKGMNEAYEKEKKK